MSRTQKSQSAIEDFDSHLDFIASRFKVLKGTSKGSAVALAKFLGVSDSLVSAALRKKRNFTIEQIVGIGKFFELSDIETEILAALFESERASTQIMREFSVKRLHALRGRIRQDKLLSEKPLELEGCKKFVFYSDWVYSAVHILTAIKRFTTAKAIADYLEIPLERVEEVLTFLTESGLCEKSRGGYQATDSSTKVMKDDPLSVKHLMNWRERAIVRLGSQAPVRNDEVLTTLIAAYSREGVQRVVAEVQKKFLEVAEHGREGIAEEAYCLNLDSFKIE